jgi:hypothetical protein
MIDLDHDGWHAGDGWYLSWPDDTPKPRLHLIREGSRVGRWGVSLCPILANPDSVG